MKKALIALGFLAAGCSAGADGSQADASPDVRTNRDAAADAPDAPVSFEARMKLVQFTGGPVMLNDPGIEGASVCSTVDTKPGCTTSDADGNVILGGFAATGDEALLATKQGFYPLLVPVRVGDGNALASSFPTDLVVGGFVSLAGATQAPGKGLLAVGVWKGNKSAKGALVTISPAASGPYYSNDGTPNPSLTSVGDRELVAFANVEPGIVTITIAGGGSCTATIGWPGAQPNEVKLPVRANTLTIGRIDCS